MNYREMLKQIVTRQKPLIDVWHYLVGNYRYKLYYSTKHYSTQLHNIYPHSPTNINVHKKYLLMREHIWEQINYRISVMNPICYSKGSCIKCGCDTTQLQMANKRCDGICYPTMMNKKDWERFKQTGHFLDIGGVWMNVITIETQQDVSGQLHTRSIIKNIFYKETNTGYVPINNN